MEVDIYVQRTNTMTEMKRVRQRITQTELQWIRGDLSDEVAFKMGP